MTAADDDIPWADPAIRTDYEAALGRFILAFNEVDYRLSQVIGGTELPSTSIGACQHSTATHRSSRRLRAKKYPKKNLASRGNRGALGGRKVLLMVP